MRLFSHRTYRSGHNAMSGTGSGRVTGSAQCPRASQQPTKPIDNGPADTGPAANGAISYKTIHGALLRLTLDRGCFRLRRTLRRMLSRRRIVFTAIVTAYGLLYLLCGMNYLLDRPPADPDRIELWLSGGMVLYVIFHAVKSAWSAQDATAAESPPEALWLAGAPIRRRSVIIHQVTGLAAASIVKTLLLCVVLAVDVPSLIRLAAGVFTALLLLELCRLIVTKTISGLSDKPLARFRLVVSLIAGAVVVQVIGRTCAGVPAGSPAPVFVLEIFRAIGSTASSDIVQWLAMPWSPAANLAVADQWSVSALTHLVLTLATLPLAVGGCVWVDQKCRLDRQRDEVMAMHQLDASRASASTDDQPLSRSKSGQSNLSPVGGRVAWYHLAAWPRPLGWIDTDAAAVAVRTATSIAKYRGTILFSFAIPVLLCLSPIFSGRIRDRWLFVVGGIAMCTTLIAPAALRIDFRRDLRRVLLLRCLPVSPRSMVLGQLWFPVLLTCLFQWTVLAPAAMLLRPGMLSVCLWAGILAALAAFTFALENALFLAFPHRPSNQGIGVVLRTNLTFLGKSSLLVAAVVVLAVWATFCRNQLGDPASQLAIFAGAQFVSWGSVVLSLAATTWCWRRLDVSADLFTDQA